MERAKAPATSSSRRAEERVEKKAAAAAGERRVVDVGASKGAIRLARVDIAQRSALTCKGTTQGASRAIAVAPITSPATGATVVGPTPLTRAGPTQPLRSVPCDIAP